MATKEDFDELHNKVRRSVVRIRATKGNQRTIVTPGTIVLTGNSFCYIIAHRNTFYEGSQARYEVVFPDSNRTTVELNVSDVATTKDIAAFFIFNVPFDVNMVQPVQFGDFYPSTNQDVYTLGFYQDTSKPSYLSPGSVNFAGMLHFVQDCNPDTFTSCGSPIFSTDGFLVGICCAERGVLLAYNVEGIATLLAIIHPEMSKKPIEDILLHIKAQGEAGAGAP